MIKDVEQFLTAHLFGVSPDAPQHAQQFRSLAVFCRGHVFQIIRAPVVNVTVEVVYLHALRSWSDPCQRDQFVTWLPVCLSDGRICAAVSVRVRLHGRGKGWLDLTQHPTVIRQNGVVYAVELACP